MSDDALQFVLSWSSTKSKRKIKTHQQTSTCAHCVCGNKRLHISWPEVVTKAISRGDLRIKDLSQIDLFFAVLYSLLSKVHEREVKYLHTVFIIHVQ